MNRDWSEFESALDSPEGLALARRALRDDPAALAELEGMAAFREEIREQGLETAVPKEELNRILERVVRSEDPHRFGFSWRRVMIPVSFAGALAAGALWLRHDPMNFAVTPTAAVIDSPTEAEAERWIESHTDFDVPQFKLPREAVLVNARYGENGAWACVDFVHHGKTFWLYVNRTGSQLSHGETRTFDGRKFYDGQGVGWKSKNLAYYLKGGSHAERWSFATFFAPQTAT